MDLALAGTCGQTVPLPLEALRRNRVAQPAGPRLVKLLAVGPQVGRAAGVRAQSGRNYRFVLDF